MSHNSKHPKWRDIPFVFIFLIFIIGFIVVAALDLKDYSHTKCYKNRYGDPRVVFFDPHILVLMVIGILATFILAGVYYCIAALHTSKFVLFSMALQIVVSLGSAIFYLVQMQWLSGAFSLVWLGLSVLMYWVVRTFIRTATIQLEVAMCVAERNPLVVVLSVLAAIFCASWSVLVGSVTLAGFGKAITAECSVNQKIRPEGEFVALLSYLTVSNYLVVEAVKAVVRVSISYTYGWWCVAPQPETTTATTVKTEQPQVYDDFPTIPCVTGMGVLAALSYSLGSICLSSLVLAVLKMAAQVLAAWSQTIMVSDEVMATQDVSIILLAWLLSNCVAVFDSVFTHLTNYILVYVAVDNVSYLEGCKRTLELVATEGLNAVLNDCLAGGTLTFGSWCIGSVVALLAYIYMRFIEPYPQDGIYFLCSYIMLMSVQICSLLTTVISCSVQTIFVVMSAEPARLREVHPRVYGALTACFP